jgi:hypothetical protein
MKTSNIRVTRLEWKKAKPDDPTVSESIVFDAFPKPAWAFPRDHFISGRVDPPARLELQFRTHTVCLETPQARQLLHDLRSGTVHAVLKAIPGQGAPAAGGNGVATVTEIIVTPHRPTPRPHS